MPAREETRRFEGTYADVLETIRGLGDIPADRILMDPLPGTATEEDVVALWEGPARRLCELVDGTLVEKPMSTSESLIASRIIYLLEDHISPDDLGVVLGEAGMLRLEKGLVRIPDVSFIPWENIPGEEMDMNVPVAEPVPDLAVEVISKSNTASEINRKLKEYFFHGTRLAWVIDPRKQTARAYTSPEAYKRVGTTGSLDGAPVLPGFRVSLPELFARLRRRKRTG